MDRRLAARPLIALLAVAALACTSKNEDCSSGLTFCGGVCADLATNGQNCGACFNACPAVATCSGGACRCPNPADVICDGACVNPATYATDPANCGACGVACGFGTCAGGVCQCEGGSPCAGQNPRCADLQNDPANCGACGSVCPKPGSGCAAGACACVAPKDDDCVAFCTDTLSDKANCGGCGNACTLTNEECAGGACACPGTLPDRCPAGSPTACVDLQSDERNCGTCGRACTKANELCSAGACTCPPELPDACPTVNPTSCVSRATDELNCGACGVRCATGATCTSGLCECPQGQEVCSNKCVNKLTDPANCGNCGFRCPSTATCTNGSCACPAAKPMQCGTSCCAGNGCCGTNACQTAHSNGLDQLGLGQLFYDCNPLGTYTLASAEAAAEAWDPGGLNISGFALGCVIDSCVGRRKASECAVWCYGDPLRGRVVRIGSPVCTCPTAGTPNWN